VGSTRLGEIDFTGKVIIVTGGASGIGLACCKEFSACGGRVAMVDRDVRRGEENVAAIRGQGGQAELFAADVSHREQVENLIGQISSHLGGVDVLVNNAGIQHYGTVTTLSEDEWDEVLNANLKSAFLMSKFSIPEMVKRGKGAIVITGSVQSVAAQRNSVHYVVSKHGLLGLTRCLALDYAAQTSGPLASCPVRSTPPCFAGPRRSMNTRNKCLKPVTSFTPSDAWGSRKKWQR
jgi:NAD(P)-dependent dehydrogenase (short-subunit alcohol dehydrogenase family)